MLRRSRAFLLPCLASLLFVPTAIRAGEVESLKGLRGFYVSSLQSIGLPKGVELKANPDALKKLEADSRAEMERVVQVELRKAGIRVFTEDEYGKELSIPNLELSEITIVNEHLTMHTAISLRVRQPVTIDANGHRMMAKTWTRDRLVLLGSDAAQRTRGTVAYVKEMMEELINDYLTANPKR